MERQVLKLLPGLAVAALLASGCGGEQGPVAGDALEVGAASTYAVEGAGALPPGVEVSLMLTPLRNVSDGDLVIRRIEPIGGIPTDGEGAAAEVVGFELAVRDQALATAVPLGFYAGARPALQVDGACVEQPTVAPEDFVLAPVGERDEDVFVVLRVRTTAEGVFGLDGLRVVYELSGVQYFQELRDGLVLHVVPGAAPDVPEAQTACLAGG
ncbi:MAG TPA: hypothetical protein VFO88_03130 [Gaiellaceae bacterium]|nr:hypothetical protein [Gaiellaceae bacterium]